MPDQTVNTIDPQAANGPVPRRAGGAAFAGAFLVFVLAAALFAPALRYDFVGWDDQSTIVGNDHLRTLRWQSLGYFWTHAVDGLYIPVAYTAWALLRAVSGEGGPNPMLFHLASAILHALAAMVAFDLLRRMTGNIFAAVAGAMVFAWHPLQVESVAWASGLKDVLCGLFVLQSLRRYWQFAAEGRGRAFYILSLIAYAIAMLCKPIAMVTPILVGVLDFGLIRTPWRELIRRIAPMLVLAVPIFVITRVSQTVWEATDTPFYTRPLIAADSLAFYLIKLIWPVNLSVVYGRAPQWVVDQGWIYYTWIIPTIVVGIAWWFRKSSPLILAGAGVLVVGLLPVLGLTRFMFQSHSTVADHYMYIPMLGIAMAVAGGIVRMSFRGAIGAVAAVLVLLAAVSSVQLRYWQNSITLFTRAVEVTPDDSGARGNLGRALAQAGRLDEAIPQFERAAALAPYDREERISLAQAMLLKGRYSEATDQARAALDLALMQSDPVAETVRENFLLGQALEGLGDLPAAEQHLTIAARQSPNSAAIRAALERVRGSIASGRPATRP